VGAYATEAMQDAQYALLEKVEARPHSFTSLGPCNDGGSGVDIYVSRSNSFPPHVQILFRHPVLL
jgi:hypothetical protein